MNQGPTPPEPNPWPAVLHDNDRQNKAKHRKMRKRHARKAVSKTCKWYRKHVYSLAP